MFILKIVIVAVVALVEVTIINSMAVEERLFVDSWIDWKQEM